MISEATSQIRHAKGIDEDRVHGDAHGERLAGAIEDRAAGGGNFDHVLLLLSSRGGVILMVHDL